jgi:DNA-binding CsgD family transcriptional regulator
MNCYIRSVDVIDRTLPELAPLFDEMRDRLRDEHGVTRARYYHAVPVADDARRAVSASPPIRALADDYVRNRRHEIDHLLLERMRLAEPTVWDRERRDDGCPPPMRATRHCWAKLTQEAIGDGWWHGFDVAAFGPGDRRGLFKINAPLEQPLDRRYMGRVRHVLQDFHLAYCTVQLAAAPRISLAPGDLAALARVAGGLKAETIGYELGITARAVEERLARVRKHLRCRTTTEAAAKAMVLGLIL